MKCMIPEEIGEADLVLSTVPVDEAQYDSQTTYNTLDRCRAGRFVYEAARDGLAGVDPETNAGGTPVNKDWLAAGYTATDDPSWLVVGMVNRWKMFDSYMSTVTESAGEAEVRFRKAHVDTLYIFGLRAEEVTVRVYDGDTVIRETAVRLRNDVVRNEYEFCWKPVPAPRSVLKVSLGFLTIGTDEISLTFSPAGSVCVGGVKAGRMTDVGRSQWDIKDGFLDFSTNARDKFGETYRKAGRYAPFVRATADLAMSEKDEVKNHFIKVRATDCVWDFNEADCLTSYDSFVVFGLCVESDFKMGKRRDTLDEARVRSSIRIEGAV